MTSCRTIAVALYATSACLLTSTAQADFLTTTVGFDGGDSQGFTGNAFFEASGGNPGGNARHLAPDLFGISLRTGAVGEPANDAFLGDFSSFESITFSFDVRTDTLRDFIGNPISREIGIALRDRDIVGPSGASGIFFSMGVLNEASQDDWTTFSVTIDDPTSPDLPPGWIGFGDEDPSTFEPRLPDAASFASVLASVDEFEITTFVPGFFFGPANTDVRIDNISVTAIPVPGTALVVVAGLLRPARRRRS